MYIKFVIFFHIDYIYLRKEFSAIMAKKECRDGLCGVNILNLSVDHEKEHKVDKKDSSKRLR